MTREMQKIIRERKHEAAELVRYANPRSKKRPSLKWVTKVLSSHIPYCVVKPVITNVSVMDYNKNRIIKYACFRIETDIGRVFEVRAYQNLKGRTQEEKEADKTANFPSGLFKIFGSVIA